MSDKQFFSSGKSTRGPTTFHSKESTSLSVLTPVAHHEDDLERCKSYLFDASLSHPFYCSSQTPQLICLTARLRRCPPTRNSWISSSVVPSASFLPRFVLVSRSVVSEVLYFFSELYSRFHHPYRTIQKKKKMAPRVIGLSIKVFYR